MKHSVRLLLFVALLLPFRGALAVTGMLCHSGIKPLTVSAPTHHAHDAGVHHHDPVQDEGSSNHHDVSCNLCSSVCGAPPLPATDVVFHQVLPTGAERFPAVAPPHAVFATSGLERPPRTI